ncbi:hypothetical protein BDZ94DRAFT_1221963 [Collybia nuda]|uniref:F-box domain-containing protein n=1 Tax=Collybia nuda TaxID=64659 RepID=A0A9P5Y2E3_9AGAR|nr:hypothetical protein BDZ94DRAFT_1221963 [Collybia nuda]
MSTIPRNLAGVSFLHLPDEIREEIIADLERHQDLVSLALVSRAHSKTVIPHHTEYRTIRIRHPMPYMWAHLARRSDLARHIREVHLCARWDYTAPDRFPTSLIDKNIDENEENLDETTRFRNVCEALRHMRHLTVFTWEYIWNSAWAQRPNPTLENQVLRTISGITSLRHLALHGNFGRHTMLGKCLDDTDYPLWGISGLTSLSFLTHACIIPSNGAQVFHMLQQSPGLEFLEMPMEFKRLADCHFPVLKTLKLRLLSGTISSIDQSRITFIENHPSIEELTWFPIGPVDFSIDSIPSIRRLKAGRQVLDALEKQNIVRHIEYLDILSLSSEDILSLHLLHRESLRMLKLHALGTLEGIYNLAQTFPNITWLSMPAVHLGPEGPQKINIDEWYEILSHFQNLEVFRGDGIWSAVDYNNNAMHVAIMNLVNLCPKLRQLDHSAFDEKRHEWKRITIRREGPEGENVRYEVRKPPPWRFFVAMEEIYS